MSLIFQRDDLAVRARANGRSIFDQLKAETRNRKLANQRQAQIKNKRAMEERRRREDEARLREVEEAAAKQQKKEQWRISWARMINMHKAADIGTARDFLHVSSERRFVARVTLKSIVRDVEDRTGVSLEQLNGTSRLQEIVRVRHYVFWRARCETALSYQEIGRRLGGRDHTTVLSGYRRFQAALDAGARWAASLAGAAR